MPVLLRPLLVLLPVLLWGCGARRATGTAREAMIGDSNPISHVELTLAGLTREDADRLERQFQAEGYLKNAVLKSFLGDTAIYEMDVRGCECDLPARLALIPHPGLRYEGRTTRVRYTAYDNQPPSVSLVYPPVWKVVGEPDPYVLVEVPDPDVAEVRINGVVAERFRGALFRARVHFKTGPAELQVEATDRSGNVGRLQRKVQVDTTPEAARNTLKVQVEGTAAPGSVVLAEGRELPVDASGHYRAEVVVQRGQRTVEVISLDASGKKTVVLEPIEGPDARGAP